MIKKLNPAVLTIVTLLTAFTSKAKAQVPGLATTFSSDVAIYNATNTQSSKIRTAERKVRDVISSEEFRSKVINHTYNGRKTFVDNGGLTNTQIYYKILYAAENYATLKDNEMDLNIKTYFENSNTVGFTTTTSKYINMNTKFLNNYTSNQVARNMTHEWLHKVGFRHAVNYSTSRDYSVPYAVGKIVESLAIYY
jgi:hypothetical protein